jgi:two-component sensor histidine kinase
MSDDGGGVQDGVIDMSKGLGFTIMRSLAEQLHGDIEFRSEKGVTTRITFPAAA